MRGGFRLGHSAFRVPAPRKLCSLAAQLLRGDTRIDEHGDFIKRWQDEVSCVADRMASQLQEVPQSAAESRQDDDLETAR